MMAVTAQTAARYLCKVRGWTITNLEVQKLLYLAHMVALGRSNGEAPLVYEAFEAWDYGPVVPSLYRRLKMFGNNPVEDIFSGLIKEDSRSAKLIKQVAEKYARKSAGELVAMTHRDDGAWAANYQPGSRGIAIPDGDILDEYRKRLQH